MRLPIMSPASLEGLLQSLSAIDAALWACAIVSACCAGLLGALLAQRRGTRKLARRVALLEQLANSTSMDLKTLLRADRRYQSELRDVEGALELLRERHDLLELRASSGTTYEHAADLVAMGLSTEQLMRAASLTLGEAELLTHLHRAETAQAT